MESMRHIDLKFDINQITYFTTDFQRKENFMIKLMYYNIVMIRKELGTSLQLF